MGREIVRLPPLMWDHAHRRPDCILRSHGLQVPVTSRASERHELMAVLVRDDDALDFDLYRTLSLRTSRE